MTDEPKSLTEKLRWFAGQIGGGVCLRAAERIEQLEGENARLQKLLRDVVSIPAVWRALDARHTVRCDIDCPLCRARATLTPSPAPREASECSSCNGLNLSCPEGCERDPKTGELLFP